jgi:hypothetical protein
MAAAIRRLKQELEAYDLSLEGIDFATDNGYLSPTVAKAVKECKLVMTTKFKSTFEVTLNSAEKLTIADIRNRMQARDIRHAPRAGAQAYYWRTEVSHPSLGKGALVIQRRKLRSGGFQYHYHFSQLKNAKERCKRDSVLMGLCSLCLTKKFAIFQRKGADEMPKCQIAKMDKYFLYFGIWEFWHFGIVFTSNPCKYRLHFMQRSHYLSHGVTKT